MSENEPSTSGRDPLDGRSDDRKPRQWIVGSEATECDHPADALRRLGGDGLNGYYQCGRCEAGIVVQDEVADLV